MVWRDDEIKSQDDFFFNGKWADDGASRILITRLVAFLEHAKEQCQVQKLTIEDTEENAAHRQSAIDRPSIDPSINPSIDHRSTHRSTHQSTIEDRPILDQPSIDH